MQDILQVVRAPDPELDDVVRRELLIQSGDAARFSNLLGFGLLGTVDAIMLLSQGQTTGLVVWSLLCLAWLLIFQFFVPALVTGPARALEVGHSPARIARRFALGQCVTGAAWGSGCVFLRPVEAAPELIAVPITALVLANAANLLFCAATPGAYRLFHASIVLTGGLGLALQQNWGLVALVVFGAGGAPPLARYGYQQVAGARLLARQNSLLVGELRQEREAVEQMNLRLAEANAELRHQATRDPLTGLPNRALFSDHLASTLARSRRAGRTLGVIYFDLDKFKAVNDTLGHGAGDDLLCQVGHRVTAVLRSSDVLARLGGDEFVVITAAGEALAERIRRVLEEPFGLAGRTVRISASLGLALDDGRLGTEELVEFADVALYRAKELGRNRVVVFGPALLDGAGRRASHRPETQSPIAPNVSHWSMSPLE
ncbi:GGDEF domain-containing protein [Kineosporia sp. NBRC 101677]|uniref:GGDEF domain-containing protein n=1 Tax=Kineosporia sp. NBRC 101677 TaxID=3032197 RepID=UPI002556CC2D|nr:GGDEF domain-containing protein [Kineosporia sp. NBRC 101677]